MSASRSGRAPSARARAAAWVLACALLATASSCGLLIGLEDRVLDTETAGTSGPGGVCITPGDCPVGGNACFVRVCVANTCGLIDAPEGTLVASQKEGDCRRVECDTSGNPVEVVDPDDPFDDGRICTDDLCDGLKPTHKPARVNKPCGSNNICNDVGSCVECVEEANCCPGGTTPCGYLCDVYKCVPDTCKNGATDPDETDMDCGGDCNPCDDGLMCVEAADCKSSVCDGTVCMAPTCTDTVKNGVESDADCGGSMSGGTCPPCADGLGCGANGDCVSKVCGGNAPKVCQAPTCTDGEHNGDELAVDCAGSSCAPGSCDDREPCNVAGDCQSGVCTGSVCAVPTCEDGVKNGNETGQDCGGDCPNTC